MDPPSSRARASTHPRVIRLLSALPLLLASGGCGLIRAPAPQLTPPMPVQAPLRKQVLQGYMPFGSIGWVNNELVMFSGRPVNRSQKDALYVWDQTSKPRLLLSNSPGGCASKQSIRAAQLRSSGEVQMFIFHKPDFNPRILPRTQPPTPSVFDPWSCSWIASPVSLRGQKWEALRKGDGFLDFSPNSNQHDPTVAVKHLDTDEQIRQGTGIRMKIPMLPMAVHAAHDDSYLVYDLNQSPADEQRWIETNNRTIWRLNRQMQGTPLNVPAGPWVGLGSGTISFLPSRPGVLITSNNFARNHEAGGAGLYLLPRDKPPQRLEGGLVEDAAISPNGCRVAYGFRPRLDTGIPEGGPRLVVLDLCDATTPDTR